MRYMDDMIILHGCKVFLKKVLVLIVNFVLGIKLELNSKTKITRIKEGIDFVGYRTWAYFKLIRKRSLYKIKRILRKYPDKQRASSYLAHAKETNSLKYVVRQILTVMPEAKTFIKTWLIKNRKANGNEILHWV